MQAFSSIRHTGAVFAEMRSRFDAPHDGPDAGVVDKLLARLRLGDLALPPLRRGGEASVSGSWTSPGAAKSWQLGRPMEHGARAQSSQPTTRPKTTSHGVFQVIDNAAGRNGEPPRPTKKRGRGKAEEQYER